MSEATLAILGFGGGIGGVSAAPVLDQRGFAVDLIEDRSAYGVDVLQRADVLRTVPDLGVLDDYLDAGFDHVPTFAPDGPPLATIAAPASLTPSILPISASASSSSGGSRRAIIPA